MPKISLNQTPKPEFKPDKIMPHLGTLFGLSEDAMAIICVEIGCLRQYTGGRTVVRRKVRDDLGAAFKIGGLIEVEMSELDRKETWYI